MLILELFLKSFSLVLKTLHSLKIVCIISSYNNTLNGTIYTVDIRPDLLLLLGVYILGLEHISLKHRLPIDLRHFIIRLNVLFPAVIVFVVNNVRVFWFKLFTSVGVFSIATLLTTLENTRLNPEIRFNFVFLLLLRIEIRVTLLTLIHYFVKFRFFASWVLGVLRFATRRTCLESHIDNFVLILIIN